MIEFVERFTLRMRPGKAWNISDVEAGVAAFLNYSCKHLHKPRITLLELHIYLKREQQLSPKAAYHPLVNFSRDAHVVEVVFAYHCKLACLIQIKNFAAFGCRGFTRFD